MKVNFDVHKQSVQQPNVDQMKRLLNRPVNVANGVKKVCEQNFIQMDEQKFHNFPKLFKLP